MRSISKQAWQLLYADLYRQTHEEAATDERVLDDAEQRLRLLRQLGLYRPSRGGNRKVPA